MDILIILTILVVIFVFIISKIKKSNTKEKTHPAPITTQKKKEEIKNYIFEQKLPDEDTISTNGFYEDFCKNTNIKSIRNNQIWEKCIIKNK